jgi:uncharacterized protein (DUF2132 family)
MKRLRLREDRLEWREVGGEVLALDMDSSTYLGANASGALLWRTLAQGTTHEDLVTELVDAYGISEAQARTDVDAFLGELSEQGLVEVWEE